MVNSRVNHLELEIIKFWCWSYAGCGSRITFPLYFP